MSEKADHSITLNIAMGLMKDNETVKLKIGDDTYYENIYELAKKMNCKIAK